MKAKLLIVFLVLIYITFGLPTTFDFRTQPSLIKFADYSLKQ